MTKQTILYSRLSREDERANESLSIENQKAFLEDYANRHGFTNIVHLSDDGWSGTRWDRPGMSKLLDEVDKGTVSTVICKDMSRAGRDYLRVELLMEKFRENGVRFLAVNDNVDSNNGMDDFTPFRNIINEWVARDTSRKIKAIFGARTASGNHVTGALPYGYLHDPADRQRWLLDEAAAPIVKRLFLGIIAGKSPTQLANELSAEGILTPSAHWNRIGAGMPGKPTANPTKWAVATVLAILGKEEYTGRKVLNKTTKESYKTKKRNPNPNGKLVFEGAIPAIVTDEEWTVVQRLRETRRRPQRATGAPNPLTGILFCSDCGQKMYNKIGKTGREKSHDEYVCSSYRHYSRSCTCHYIRVEVVQELILDTIRRVSKYALANEAEFTERVRQESAIREKAAVKDNKRNLTKSKRRRGEITELVRKLYESYATGKIPETHFAELLKSYDTEQIALDSEIERLQKEVEDYHTDSMKADRFMELVKKNAEFKELTPLLLNEFIEKVVVHEADKSTGKRTQQVDIHLNFIGNFQLPESELPPRQEPPSTLSRGRKPRHLMSEDEREELRNYDRARYAKKKAARLAVEEAERAKILAGTSFEKLSPKSIAV